MPEFRSDAAVAAATQAQQASKGQKIIDARAAMGPLQFDQIAAGYIMAAYFTDTGEDEQPSSECKMSEHTALDCLEAVAEFVIGAGLDAHLALASPGYDATQMGHDLWYTRNGHGVGFWSREQLDSDDPGEVTLGERLTKVAGDMGNVDLYEGDDGKLYFGG